MPQPAPAATATAALALVGLGVALAAPARALEQIELQVPLVETTFTIKLAELGESRGLLDGSSDLAELNRASDGAIGRRIVDLFNAPLPLQTRAVVSRSAGSPLLQQALLLLSSLGGVDGLPVDLSGNRVSAALDRAASQGSLTMLGVLKALPGRTARVDLEKGLSLLSRLNNQLRPAERLLQDTAPTAANPALSNPGPRPVRRSSLSLPVPYRTEPLGVVVIQPEQEPLGRLVIISHGLWDGPENFEGWARHLASHGYVVLLPRHPGSDFAQRQAMLSGTVPPPGPAELRLRPLDVSALIDAAAAGKLPLAKGLRTDSVAVLGHSWGATTALQLAGARPSSRQLQRRCQDLQDPERNLSWVLQCSFLSSADQAALADPRVKAVVAVSPPMALLFDAESASSMQARALVVSGSRDWVVPPVPEAIGPMARQLRRNGDGHRLVLVRGGDHFNLPSPDDAGGGPLRGLLLGWVNGAFAAGPAVAPARGAPALLPPDGWGDDTLPLSDVSDRLQSWSP